MIENRKSNLNQENKIWAIFMDLSKIFDTLDHFLLRDKLEVCGFNNLSIKFMRNRLTNRKQRCKVKNCFDDDNI